MISKYEPASEPLHFFVQPPTPRPQPRSDGQHLTVALPSSEPSTDPNPQLMRIIGIRTVISPSRDPGELGPRTPTPDHEKPWGQVCVSVRVSVCACVCVCV